jgi:hypothetical protein
VVDPSARLVVEVAQVVVHEGDEPDALANLRHVGLPADIVVVNPLPKLVRSRALMAARPSWPGLPPQAAPRENGIGGRPRGDDRFGLQSLAADNESLRRCSHARDVLINGIPNAGHETLIMVSPQSRFPLPSSREVTLCVLPLPLSGAP